MELSGSVSLGLLSKHGSGRMIELNNLPNYTKLSDKIKRYLTLYAAMNYLSRRNSIVSFFANALDYSIISRSSQRKCKEVV